MGKEMYSQELQLSPELEELSSLQENSLLRFAGFDSDESHDWKKFAIDKWGQIVAEVTTEGASDPNRDYRVLAAQRFVAD